MNKLVDQASEYKLTYAIVSRAHHLAAKKYARLNTILGVPVVAITATLGTSIFYTMESSPSTKWKIFAGLIVLVAAVLSALQTSMGFAEKAEAHRLAGIRYAGVRRRLELFMLRIEGDQAGSSFDGISELESLSARMSELAGMKKGSSLLLRAPIKTGEK